MSRSEPSFGDAPGLRPQLGVSAVLVGGVVVAALLRWLPRWPGLAHEVALPPLDFFADVRVLMVRAPTPAVFGVGVTAALVARAALLALLTGFSRRRFTFALRFYLAALVPALLASGLDFSGRAILYAYLIWGGLLVVFAAFIILGAVPWAEGDVVHRALGRVVRQRFRFGTLAAYLVALAVVGDVWRRPGAASQALVVPLSGLLTAITARRLSMPPKRRVPLRAVAIAIAVVVVIVVAVPHFGSNPHGSTAVAPGRAGSLLLVAGVDTSTGNGAMFRFDPRALGFSCAQTFYYSYRGPGRGGAQGDAQCPITSGAPYRKADTTRPLHALAAGLRAQISRLPRPVVVVTHSQGAWIAWSEITTYDDTRVSALVMLAPFADGLAPYPPPNVTRAGAAGGVAVRLMTDLGRNLGISRFDPDAPLARELQGTPGAVERLVAHRLPRTVRGAAVIARADLPLEPRPWPNGLPEACPGWLTHAALPTSSTVTATIDTFLRGRSLPGCPRGVAVVGHATDAFGAPSPAASH